MSGPGLVGGVAAIVGFPLPAGVEAADDLLVRFIVIAGVDFIVAADLAGLLGFFHFVAERLDDGVLHEFAAAGVDRVGDVRMQLGAAVGIATGAVFIEPRAAVVAEAGAE